MYQAIEMINKVRKVILEHMNFVTHKVVCRELNAIDKYIYKMVIQPIEQIELLQKYY